MWLKLVHIEAVWNLTSPSDIVQRSRIAADAHPCGKCRGGIQTTLTSTVMDAFKDQVWWWQPVKDYWQHHSQVRHAQSCILQKKAYAESLNSLIKNHTTDAACQSAQQVPSHHHVTFLTGCASQTQFCGGRRGGRSLFWYIMQGALFVGQPFYVIHRVLGSSL